MLATVAGLPAFVFRHGKPESGNQLFNRLLSHTPQGTRHTGGRLPNKAQ